MYRSRNRPSFVCSFVLPSIIQICSSLLQFIHSFVPSFICSLVHSFTRSFTSALHASIHFIDAICIRQKLLITITIPVLSSLQSQLQSQSIQLSIHPFGFSIILTLIYFRIEPSRMSTQMRSLPRLYEAVPRR